MIKRENIQNIKGLTGENKGNTQTIIRQSNGVVRARPGEVKRRRRKTL